MKSNFQFVAPEGPNLPLNARRSLLNFDINSQCYKIIVQFLQAYHNNKVKVCIND